MDDVNVRSAAGLKVIGVGFGRTGTASLLHALQILGFGPCYHMFDVMDDPRRIRDWLDVAQGARPDWDRMFEGYRSAVDWPVAAYWRELAAAYPDAKLVLTVRDPEQWYDSVRRTIFRNAIDPPRGVAGAGLRLVRAASPDLRAFLRMVDATVLQRVFGGRVDRRAEAVSVFLRHIADVQAEIPPERLLTYSVTEGWPPLCAFLGRPVPAQPFPHDNRAESFGRESARRAANLVLNPLRPAFGPMRRPAEWSPGRRDGRQR